MVKKHENTVFGYKKGSKTKSENTIKSHAMRGAPPENLGTRKDLEH